jgi:hypothetical protein
MNDDLTKRYNYDVFTHDNYEPLMKWEESPAIASDAPDFPLWNLDESESSLSALWKANKFLVVEFGSFT